MKLKGKRSVLRRGQDAHCRAGWGPAAQKAPRVLTDIRLPRSQQGR